jgi:peptidoglycan LD-endopeptidase CwlK
VAAARITAHFVAAGTVIFIGIALYLLLVSALAAWLLLPGLRQWLRRRLATAAAGGRGLWQGGRGAAARSLASGRVPLAATAQAVSGVRRHLRWWLPALVVLLAVPALTLWLRHWNAYDGFDHTASREINPQVAALLQGEQLVPPAPLPPELFLTREVERQRPATASASRRWELLDEDFRNRLLAVYRIMREQHGFEMVLLEGYRSPERQAELASLGPQVTHAGAGESYHQYGLAADSAFLVKGRVVISEQDPVAARGYELFGAVAQSAGLVWGGGWRTLKDLGHVELRRPGLLRRRAAVGGGQDQP